jgi:hypothetical protein
MSNLAPSSVQVQQQSVQFNNPVSESSLASIGGACNQLLLLLLPVGSIIDSMLNETQFNAVSGAPSGTYWVPCDGRDCTGSAYATISGYSSVPDLRGVFRRGLNNFGTAFNTRSDQYANPDDLGGNFVNGQMTAARVGPHVHNTTAGGGFGPVSPYNLTPAETNQYRAHQTTDIPSGGGLDTAPTNASIITYIRIN